MRGIVFRLDDWATAKIAYDAWRETKLAEAAEKQTPFFVHRKHGHVEPDGSYCLRISYRDTVGGPMPSIGMEGHRDRNTVENN